LCPHAPILPITLTNRRRGAAKRGLDRSGISADKRSARSTWPEAAVMPTTSKYRSRLPHLSGGLFLTDGGIETTLIFHEGLELPHFAAFHLLRRRDGRDALARYYERYIAIAKADGVGFILESPTWRASTDWGGKLAYTHRDIAAANRDAIALMHELRTRHESARTPIVVSGCVGPRGDGYDPGQVMSAAEAERYHAHQIGTFAEAGADMVTALYPWQYRYF
jgi:S-methylmethionine-dependent homocysteine/selenocysteine methylase